MEFLLSGGFVHITIWMHLIDANKTLREKSTWKLHNNAWSYHEQILLGTLYKTAAI